MKKFFLFLLALPMLAMVACDDDNTPEVNVNVSYKNATVVDGTAYVIKDSVASIERLWVEAVNPDHTATIIRPVNYIFSNGLAGVGDPVNNGIMLYTDSVGTYVVSAAFEVAEEDCSLAVCAAQWDYKVVNDSTEIPQGGTADGIVSKRN